MAEPASTTPSQLAKFPAEVKEAYSKYRATGDPEAVQLIVMAALQDFLPKREGQKGPIPQDDQRLIEDLGYDSLAVAETVFFLEDLFDVKIGNEDLLKLETVGELRAFVAANVTANAAPPASRPRDVE